MSQAQKDENEKRLEKKKFQLYFFHVPYKN